MPTQIADAMKERGLSCEAVPSTVDDGSLQAELRRTLTYRVSHKMVATRAGLGWIGKTDLLVSRRFGPRVRLASILTSEPLETGVPMDSSQCHHCRLCVDACPAQAATGAAWTAGVTRDVFFNAFACRDYCRKISQEKLGKVISLCGKCVSLCPIGH